MKEIDKLRVDLRKLLGKLSKKYMEQSKNGN